MALTVKQLGVFKGMVSAMLLSILSISLAVIYDPFNYVEINHYSQRLEVLGGTLILPILLLIVSIGDSLNIDFLAQKI
ncbi:hypothetical protein [Shewanella sp. UCD-KL12]|uniref:hypothetical protein n=1 Tax=Shewanella sp. UCD-KL12 TaxID=1917163 RepID=UPI001C4D02A2|nr:hypothetical protein [Shewanella sp. UCD-KL12]